MRWIITLTLLCAVGCGTLSPSQHPQQSAQPKQAITIPPAATPKSKWTTPTTAPSTAVSATQNTTTNQTSDQITAEQAAERVGRDQITNQGIPNSMYGFNAFFAAGVICIGLGVFVPVTVKESFALYVIGAVLLYLSIVVLQGGLVPWFH